MPTVGMKRLVYAVMTDEANETYGPVKPLAPTINGNVNPTTNSATNYADDGPDDTATSLGDIPVSLNTSDLTTNVQADLLGHNVDANGVLIKSANDKAPYVAIGWMSEMSNGGYMYVWLYKGKFRAPSQNYQTKSDQPQYQNPTIEATFIRRKKDGQWQAIARDTDAGFPGEDAWFAGVYEKDSDATAPTVTVSPVDGASAVAVDSNVVWTFDKAIQNDSVNDANFIVMDSLGSFVVGNLSLDGTGKIVTFDPTANLSSGMDYIAIATKNVRSVSGYAMAANSVTNFATA